MKKIISFILLTASASCTILFAQAENRLEATNQVRGCRLQLVATNQTTNYRLQVEDNNKIELSSECQIRQQAKPTTNCELRTTNCNNSGTDLSCYLMMNPSSIEEGTKAVGEALGIVGRGEEAAGVSSASGGRDDVARISSISLFSEVFRLQNGGSKPKK